MSEHLSFSVCIDMYVRDCCLGFSSPRNLTGPFMQPFIAQWWPLLVGKTAALTESNINSDHAMRATRGI